MEFVAQLVERQNVDLEVMGSSPIILPKCFNSSVGRAFALQAKGPEFESPWVHNDAAIV